MEEYQAKRAINKKEESPVGRLQEMQKEGRHTDCPVLQCSFLMPDRGGRIAETDKGKEGWTILLHHCLCLMLVTLGGCMNRMVVACTRLLYPL